MTAQGSARPVLFHATDVYGGSGVEAGTRSATLDGSVPLRAAQSCPPFLAGNAAGIVLTLTRGIRVERRFGRVHAELEDEDGDLARRHRAALPSLVSRGLISSLRAESLRPLRVSGSSIFFFTGLLLRPETGIALHLTHAGNRRSTFFRVAPLTYVREERGIPLVLELVLEKDTPSRFRIAGETATLLPLRSGSTVDLGEIETHPELAARHAAFYDAAYFDAKREDPTGKYRRLKPQDAEPGDPPPVLTVARMAGSGIRTEDLDRFATAESDTAEPGPPVSRARPPVATALVFDNVARLSALYDGLTLSVEPDAKALAREAAEVATRYRAVVPEELRKHPGGLLYLTKYVTPHVPGEPHFFVKAFAFLKTPPGVSCVLDGLSGTGWDVLRGVVATDVFHAAPAVFHLRKTGERVTIPQGAPLLRILPVPRDLLAGTFVVEPFDALRE